MIPGFTRTTPRHSTPNPNTQLKAEVKGVFKLEARKPRTVKRRKGLGSVVAAVFVFAALLLVLSTAFMLNQQYTRVLEEAVKAAEERVRSIEEASRITATYSYDPSTGLLKISIFNNNYYPVRVRYIALSNGTHLYYRRVDVIIPPGSTKDISLTLSPPLTPPLAVSLAEVGRSTIGVNVPVVNETAAADKDWQYNDTQVWTRKRVGVGTNAPEAALDVNGSTILRGSLRLLNVPQNDAADRVLVIDENGFVYWRNASTLGGAGNITISDDDWFWNGDYLYVNPRASAVGIGTSNPQAKLDVAGNLRVANPSVSGRYISMFFGLFNDIEYGGAALVIHPGPGYDARSTLYLGGLGDFKVGVGTDTPEAMLHIVGNPGLKVQNPQPSSMWVRFYFGALNDLAYHGGALVIHPEWTNGYNPRGLLYLSNDPDDIKVGIGTDNPQYKLDVNGDVLVGRVGTRVGDKVFPPDSGYPSGWSGGVHTWDVYAEESLGVGPSSGFNGMAAVQITYDVSGGRIVIRDSNGKDKVWLDAGNIHADYFWLTEGGNDTGFALDFFPNAGGGTIGDAAGFLIDGSGRFFINRYGYAYSPRYYITEEGSETSPKWHLDYVPDNGRLAINYDGGGSPIELVSVLPNGNVGIGTSNPKTRLHVAGNAKIEGDLDLTGNRIYNVDDLLISGGGDSIGAIYGPDGRPYLVFRSNGLYTANLQVSSAAGRVLAVDDSGKIWLRSATSLAPVITRDNLDSVEYGHQAYSRASAGASVVSLTGRGYLVLTIQGIDYDLSTWTIGVCGLVGTDSPSFIAPYRLNITVRVEIDGSSRTFKLVPPKTLIFYFDHDITVIHEDVRGCDMALYEWVYIPVE